MLELALCDWRMRLTGRGRGSGGRLVSHTASGGLDAAGHGQLSLALGALLLVGIGGLQREETDRQTDLNEQRQE